MGKRRGRRLEEKKWVKRVESKRRGRKDDKRRVLGRKEK